MEQGSYGPEVINNDDGNAQIDRQLVKQPYVGIETASRTAHANDGKISTDAQGFGGLLQDSLSQRSEGSQERRWGRGRLADDQV